VKVAVTGATGFIGRHVVAELKRRSISPVLICRPSSRVPVEFSAHSIVTFELGNPPTNAFDLLDRPDVLIHLAWGGLPNYGSLHHFENELPLHYHFLRRMVEAGLSNLLVTGTCLEYGMRCGPLAESCEPRPENPYAFAKDSLRRQLDFLRKTRLFNLTWARLFYLYGDDQHSHCLLPQLRAAVARGDATFNMSGGEQLRDYLPVICIAQYLVSLAVRDQDTGIVNICSGNPISVRKLVENWIAENHWRIDLNLGHYPYPAHEPMAFWGDGTKLNRCLDRA
jgi:dTDP-6-deoxy-L-talose 4-dehydrogenase (NAD+)